MAVWTWFWSHCKKKRPISRVELWKEVLLFWDTRTYKKHVKWILHYKALLWWTGDAWACRYKSRNAISPVAPSVLRLLWFGWQLTTWIREDLKRCRNTRSILVEIAKGEASSPSWHVIIHNNNLTRLRGRKVRHWSTRPHKWYRSIKSLRE